MSADSKIPIIDDSAAHIEGRINVLVAEDFPIMLKALVSCIESVQGAKVVATAVDGNEALGKATKLDLDLVVTDLLMPVMDGFRLLRELRIGCPSLKLVAVSGQDSPALEQAAILAGADAFISKDHLTQDLVNTVVRLCA